MSLKALLRDVQGQRAIALESDTHVLVLRHNPTADELSRQSSQSSPSKCIVDFTNKLNFDSSGFKVLRPGGVHGTLGLINLGVDVFICLITAASDRAEVRPGENVKRILEVEFYGLTRGDFDHDIHHDPFYEDLEDVLSSGQDYSSGQDRREGIVHPCQALRKLLSDGSFYYSFSFDLTNSLQRRAAVESRFDIDSLDRGYLWNSYMIDPLIGFRSRLAELERAALDTSQIITTVIRGYVESFQLPTSRSPIRSPTSSKPSRLLLISRLSCRRAGTRFNARGIDDDGNVANFVESETFLWHPSGLCFSYTQVRGSVPIFWEQTAGLVPQQQKIQITRSKEATQPAFDKHMDELEHKYGTVHVLNLLAERKPGEEALTQNYHEHIRVRRSNLNDTLLMATHYDFHSETSGADGYVAANAVRNQLHNHAKSMAYFLADNHPDGGTATVLHQQGIFRTNCLDCLDRTNLIQTILSEKSLEIFLQHRGERPVGDFITTHSTLWANNGDALSKIYAGTGALKSSFTRHGKMSLAGAIADARKSVKRLYVNNFQDTARQNVIDTLLGRLVDQSAVYLYDPVSEYVKRELEKRTEEYTRSKEICIWSGTFNLNGKAPKDNDSLSIWLQPENHGPGSVEPDIYVVSFQEIVELSPQQIMSTDPAHLREWEKMIGARLNATVGGAKTQYIQLRSGQLVGAALIIYVKADLLPAIKNVEGTNKKTGMSGIAGNKGAVAIRLDISDTRMCFVTSHLAAGHSNVEDRNRDYRTIADGLRFPRNRSIDDHDVVIWLGDFNYRIDGENDQTRRMIESGALESLYQHDQLNKAMSAAVAFPYYSEGPIAFPPTYKYDNGTDDYDSSEKQRIPAWCDRILFKGKGIRQLCYDTAPLRFSDHRPVYAMFRCAVDIVDEGHKQKLIYTLYTKRREALVQSSNISSPDLLDDWNVIRAPAAGTLSAYAPTNQRKWWIRDGLSARSDVEELRLGQVPNSNRPANPFTPTDEPDWVNVSYKASTPASTRKDPTLTGPASPVVLTSTKRKPAPVVPRKPAALAALEGPPALKHEPEDSQYDALDQPSDTGPALPPRPKQSSRPVDPAVAQAFSQDLLTADDVDSLESIPSLIPSRANR